MAFLSGGSLPVLSQTTIRIPEIIYDNSSGDNPESYSRTEEFGDEVYVKAAPEGSSWLLTEFQMEYFGDFTPQGDEKARFRIYVNDGEGRFPAPNTMLYDSGEFALEAGYKTQRFEGLSLPIPASFTWTVQFSGLRNVKGDSAGLLLRPVPDVGRSFKDFWIKAPTGWRLAKISPPNPNLAPDPVTNPDPIENFGCRAFGLPAGPTIPPGIRIRPDGEFVAVEWFRGGRLQVADAIGGPFKDVPNARPPFKMKIESGAMKFWRETAAPVAAP